MLTNAQKSDLVKKQKIYQKELNDLIRIRQKNAAIDDSFLNNRIKFLTNEITKISNAIK